MNLKEIKELIDLVSEKGIQELELERSGVRILIRRGVPVATTSLPAVPAAATQPPVVAPVLPGSASSEASRPAAAVELLHIIKSPIVGTFYRAASPDAEPFVSVGAQVEKGTVICIIEAMKLMNEIEADIAGEIVNVFAEDGQPVEYGEQLFALRPK